MKFSIQRYRESREKNAILTTASHWIIEDEASKGTIPIGSVEYCLPIFGDHNVNFYPAFLKRWVTRPMLCVAGHLEVERLFVKDCTAWKSAFDSKVYENTILPYGSYWISEPVEFVQEWRYYVAAGKVLSKWWYQGVEDEVAPEINVDWPTDFSGAVDFGRLNDGRIELVEAHPPFACGWYGENPRDYMEWQKIAWQHRSWWYQQK